MGFSELKTARQNLNLRTRRGRLNFRLRWRGSQVVRHGSAKAAFVGSIPTLASNSRLTRRGIRGNKFYCVDTTTGKRTSLGTTNEDEARQIVEARNNSERQPVLNLQIAKAYLAGTDNGIATRTWQQAIESLASTKQGANQHRWQTAARDNAFVPLLPRSSLRRRANCF
jgi:hypothetical protein